MGLFRRRNGEGVWFASPPKRAKPRLDSEDRDILRCRAYALCKLDGVTVEDIALTFGVSKDTVERDVNWLIARQAAGLPTHIGPLADDAEDDAEEHY